MRLRLGTRGSPLALWQARHVAGRLCDASPGLDVEITIITTSGDQKGDAVLDTFSGQGVFVREIESALINGVVDLAVHSLKDLPTDTPGGLQLAAILKRHDPRDALVSRSSRSIYDLKPGAAVGTGSPRRRCQLLHAREDLSVQPVRGNVDTRLRKLEAGEFDAIVLAIAGLERLGLTNVPYAPIPVTLCLPAPGQGALAIEIRSTDDATRDHVVRLHDPATAACVAAERTFLAALGAGCMAPAGALATLAGQTLGIEGMIGTPDGRSLKRDRVEGAQSEAEALGAELARRLFEAGGDAILREVRAGLGPGGS
jgi:hydroxymethylbilane synthase